MSRPVMTMALTIRQPFTSKIVAGTKTVENRTRRSGYRGRLAVHAGVALWDNLTDREVEAAERLPRAAILGTVSMIGCHRASRECKTTGCTKSGGWIMTGLWHWVFENAQEFVTPISDVKGQLGIWEVTSPSLAHLISIAEVLS